MSRDIEDWKHEVANDETTLGYEEWLEHKREEGDYDSLLLPADEDDEVRPFLKHVTKGKNHGPCVMFLARKPLYFYELWENDTAVTGYVINGGWTLYMLKEGDERRCYFSDTLADCTEENLFKVCDASQVVIVPVPKEHRGDYNDAINYAESIDLEAQA